MLLQSKHICMQQPNTARSAIEVLLQLVGSKGVCLGQVKMKWHYTLAACAQVSVRQRLAGCTALPQMCENKQTLSEINPTAQLGVCCGL